MEELEKTPFDQLPIEWVEPRICTETFENRQALREGGWRWRPVPPDPETGYPSGLIEVPDPSREQQSMLRRHRDILEDPSDPWADYVDVRSLPVDATGIPYWIHRRARKWEAWDSGEGDSKGLARRDGKEPFLPVRCKAIKKDGSRCWAWSVDKANDGHCRSHAPGAALAANQGHQIALAKVKLMQAAPQMVDELESLAMTATSEQVRLKAVESMLDRGGVHAGTDVHIGISADDGTPDPAQEIRNRLASLGRRLSASPADDDIVDAEVIDETNEQGERAS